MRSKLIDELDDHFPQQLVLDALGVVYPQFLMHERCKESFESHLDILKGFYCEVKPTKRGNGTKQFTPLLGRWELNLQQSMFKMPMKSNSKATMLLPYDKCPLAHSWRTVNQSTLLESM